MGVYQENFDEQVGGRWSEYELLRPNRRARPKTFKIIAFSEFSYFLRILDVFLNMNTLNEILTICRELTRQNSLDRHPYWVFYEILKMAVFGHFGGHFQITYSPIIILPI